MNSRVFSLVFTLTFTLTNTLSAQVKKSEISLDDIYVDGLFQSQGVDNIRSLNDGKHFSILEEGKRISAYSYESGRFTSTLMDLSTLPEAPFTAIHEYELSPDESNILLVTKPEKIYRYSFSASYYIFNRKTNSLQALSPYGKQRLATFSPDGKKVAFVRNNNLFIKNLETSNEVQATFDGKATKIINGAPDWVYEEEFGFTRAFDWSPDSRKIAYYHFDERAVKEMDLTIYNSLYPSHYDYKYPKAGERNSVVTIHLLDIESNKDIMVYTGSETDQYIPRIKWTFDPSVLSITRLNRLQNHLEILHADAGTGQSKIVYQETEDKYISEATDDMITYLGNGRDFIIMSERDGWRHLYLYNFQTGTISPVTTGRYDIDKLIGYDRKTGKIYFTSHERSPLNLDVYSITTDGRNKTRLTSHKGWNEAVFSKTYRYFINTWSDINTPPVTTLNDSEGHLIRTLQDNRELKTRMQDKGFSNVDFFSVQPPGEDTLFGYILKPPGFDPARAYPLFMYVYGGPESQNVKDEYLSRMPWFQLLAQKGFVVACVDNRGTDARGEAFRKSTYMQLGRLETEDQLFVARYLGAKPWIDKERIGIFGWSYGGFMSLSCLFKGDDIFKMAIAVAPVTNWRFYDTIYTERFMRTPAGNPEGYDHNSPVFFTDMTKGKLLLIHGMADDNVHLQNSAELIKSLVFNNKQFDMQFYPNLDHSIHGGNATLHLYTRMTRFIEGNL